MTLIIRTGREVERAGTPAPAAITKGQRPETIDHYRLVIGVLEKAAEFACRGIETHNCATAEISNEQLACVLAESARRKSQTPWRVNLVQMAARIRTGCEAGECSGL